MTKNLNKQYTSQTFFQMQYKNGETWNNVGEQAAQFTLAIRKIQEGQMWGVKAATWRY